MIDDTDIALLDKIQFHVDHQLLRVASNNPGIFLTYFSGDRETNLKCLALHWHGRVIPVSANERRLDVETSIDRTVRKMSTNWQIMNVGQCRFVPTTRLPSFVFKGHSEFFFAAQLALNALRIFGGFFNRPGRVTYVYKSISAEFDHGLQKQLYGSKN